MGGLHNGGSKTEDRVFISIGSNLGDRAANCRKAVGLLGGEPASIRVVALSGLYETEPWGADAQPAFLNLAVEVSTTLKPIELLARLKEIEAVLGRTPAERWGPRHIDLDIVYYGARVIKEHDLVVPHPHCRERGFVLAPLAELAPDFIDPVVNSTIAELLALIDEDGIIRRLDSEVAS